MSSSELQVQLDAITTIFSSNLGQLLGLTVLGCFVCLVLLSAALDFICSLGQYHFDRRAANQCDDLHKGKRQGRCHCCRCLFRAGCPYFEKLTLRKRWQQFRAKKNKPD